MIEEENEKHYTFSTNFSDNNSSSKILLKQMNSLGYLVYDTINESSSARIHRTLENGFDAIIVNRNGGDETHLSLEECVEIRVKSRFSLVVYL
jgi:hypothetical protein